MRSGVVLWFVGLLFAYPILGQSTINTSAAKQDDYSMQKKRMLQQLYRLQEGDTTNQNFGGFVSYRKYYFTNRLTEDPNAFLTALVLATLRKNEKAFDSEELALIQKMRKRSDVYFTPFNNLKDSLRYNFWRKSPPEIFPGNAFMHLFRKSQALPDDIDDCALVNIAKNRDSLSIVRLKESFAVYANGMLKNQKSFYKQFKKDTIYSTWLGAAFPIDIDISVLSNVLMLNAYYHLKESTIDSNSLDLIIQTVLNKKHINDAAYVSKHYAQSAVIIYHLAKLISFHHFKQLDTIQFQLIKETKQLLLNQSVTVFEKLILQNALMLMGERPVDEYIPFDFKIIYEADFPFFIANMTAILNNPWNRWITKTNIARYDYYCPAYILTLFLENLILKNQYKS